MASYKAELSKRSVESVDVVKNNKAGKFYSEKYDRNFSQDLSQHKKQHRTKIPHLTKELEGHKMSYRKNRTTLKRLTRIGKVFNYVLIIVEGSDVVTEGDIKEWVDLGIAFVGIAFPEVGVVWLAIDVFLEWSAANSLIAVEMREFLMNNGYFSHMVNPLDALLQPNVFPYR